MKAQTEKHVKSREGGALVMVMLVLLTFSVLQIGLYKMRETSAVESVYVEQHKQAFWLAESGLNDGVFLIDYSKTYRDAPTAISNTTANGTYDISVVRSTIDLTKEIYEYEVTSVGTVNGFSRQLRKIVQTQAGGKYAIIGISGTTELAANVTINGDIAQIDGDVIVKDSRLLDGDVILGNGDLYDTKGEAEIRDFPPPPPPTIDSTDYNAQLAFVSGLPPVATLTMTNSIPPGATVFVNTDDFNFGVSGSKLSVGDGAIIVVSGDISIAGAGTKIGNNVTIISGDDISFKVQVAVGDGTDIYADQNIHFESGSKLDSNGNAILLMSKNGDITMDSNFDFRGIMIAETGDINLNANGTIEGTIIGGIGVDAAANLNITYDDTVFSDTHPINGNIAGDVILTSISWQEL